VSSLKLVELLIRDDMAPYLSAILTDEVVSRIGEQLLSKLYGTIKVALANRENARRLIQGPLKQIVLRLGFPSQFDSAVRQLLEVLKKEDRLEEMGPILPSAEAYVIPLEVWKKLPWDTVMLREEESSWTGRSVGSYLKANETAVKGLLRSYLSPPQLAKAFYLLRQVDKERLKCLMKSLDTERLWAMLSYHMKTKSQDMVLQAASGCYAIAAEVVLEDCGASYASYLIQDVETVLEHPEYVDLSFYLKWIGATFFMSSKLSKDARRQIVNMFASFRAQPLRFDAYYNSAYFSNLYDSDSREAFVGQAVRTLTEEHGIVHDLDWFFSCLARKSTPREVTDAVVILTFLNDEWVTARLTRQGGVRIVERFLAKMPKEVQHVVAANSEWKRLRDERKARRNASAAAAREREKRLRAVTERVDAKLAPADAAPADEPAPAINLEELDDFDDSPATVPVHRERERERDSERDSDRRCASVIEA
jgi:hypothetical protein